MLDSAVAYARTTLERARSSRLTLPTPCADWDLEALLLHMEDSLSALGEAADLGRVAVRDERRHGEAVGVDGLVDQLVQQACTIRSAWLARLTSAPVTVGDLTLGRDTLVLVGALEIAVHGWDVAEATGSPSPIPEDLAVRLYDVALAVVTPQERGRRFGPPVDVAPTASTGRRLLGHLGRG